MVMVTEAITLEFTYDYEYENGTEGPHEAESPFTCDTDEVQMHQYYAVFQPLVYSLVFLLGLAGNSLLLIVLLQRRTHLRMTDIYLLHLALADLLLLLTFPFAVTQVLAGWLFGNFMCKLLGLLNRLNLLCGSLLLACIGFDRYLAIVHAVSSLRTRRPKVVHLICTVLWLFCLVVSIPNAVFLSVKPRWNDSTWQQCDYNEHAIHANNWIISNRLLTHLLCFFLPLVIMGYCYTAVVVTLYHSQQSLEKQGAIRLAMVVTVVFCLCWLPYNVTLFVDTLVMLEILAHASCQGRNALAQSLLITESIGFIHCCLNPILYAFVGVRFRKELLRLLAKHMPACGRWFTRVPVSEAPTSTTSTQYI